jgi:hypothetical protein
MTGRSTDTAEPADPFDLEPIPLPESRGVGRAQQRRRRRRRHRIQYLGVAAAMVAILGVVGVVLSVGGDDGDGDEDPSDGPAGAAALSPPVLLAQTDGSGRATSLTVFIPGPGGGGNLLLIPPGTMTEVVSLGLEPVSRSLELGGEARLHATVENLLGATVDGAVVVDDATLTALLSPVGPLQVDVPERVEQVDPGGRVQVLYQAGRVTVMPEDVPRFLSTKGQGTDLARLARHQAFFDSWLTAVRERPDAAPTSPPSFAKAFDALVAGNVRTRVLPVEAFGTASVEGELYRVRTEEMTRLVVEIFPSVAKSGLTARPRIQILNGTGAVGLADAVRNKLGAGFDVRLTGNASTFDREMTEVVFYDRDEQAAAERVRTALGVGELVFSRRPLDVVDVTIIVGKDFSTE